ncbi:protein phosphatase 1 regulatory subunit 37 [Hoplias malabaricus]|uniref:protein phosphatase 1 regulatory subunit 37 n=1 Tax=Hoplias malabaricus TaxID=27720 RepID=UPI003462E3B1
MTGHTEEEEAHPFRKKCRGEKRVSFPPDEEMVSGFAESRDTLRDGVSLDYRSCESLEEILKSIQFNLINLQGAELEENGLCSLLDMILYYESATHLDISSSSMGVSGWQALSRLLKQSGCLWRLDACNVLMLEYPAQVLSKALLSSSLTELHLENSCLSGKPLFTLDCAEPGLCEGANVSAEKSKSRSGHGPLLAAPGVEIISSLFSRVGGLKKNTALQELYLRDNELNSYQDAMQLGELLKYNNTLKSLDLSDNAISDSDCGSGEDGMACQRPDLNPIEHLWDQLGRAVGARPFLRTLDTLDLSRNNLENQGIHTMKESLMMNRSLTRLSLTSVGITCEGAVVLAEILAESRVLHTLDVKQNSILTGGLMALALALRINRTLLQLDLDQNPKEEKEAFYRAGECTVLPECLLEVEGSFSIQE